MSKTIPYECVMKVCAVKKGKTKKAQKEWTKIANTLYFEHMMYQGALQNFDACPAVPTGMCYGEFMEHRYLVMERMEGDLMQLARAVSY